MMSWMIVQTRIRWLEIHVYIIIIIIRAFCPRAGTSLQAQEPRLQFCRRQVFHRKLRNQVCSFTRDCIGEVASRCFPHPNLSLASEKTLKDLKRSQGHQRGGEENICLTGPSGLHRNSTQGLSISSIRVFDQIRIRKSQSPFALLFIVWAEILEVIYESS